MSKKDNRKKTDRASAFSLNKIAYGEGSWISDFNDRNSLLKTAFFNALISYIDLSVTFRGNISKTQEAKIIAEMVLAGSLEDLRAVIRYYKDRGNYSLEVHADDVPQEEEQNPYQEIYEEIIFEELDFDDDPED